MLPSDKNFKIKQGLDLLRSMPEFSALFSLAGVQERLPSICTDTLAQIGRKARMYLWNGLLAIQVDAISPPFSPQDFSFFTGVPQHWKGHSLGSKPLFWWRTPSEPDFTQLLKRLFFPDGSRHATVEAHTFLCALLSVAKSAPDPDILPFCAKDIFCVECEQPAANGFLDLLFSWRCNDQLCMTALEIKFGAEVKNPLKEYASLTKGAWYHSNIVVGCYPRQKRVAEKHGWKFAYWFSLLREWESRLFVMKYQSVPDNTRLRSSLWHKVEDAYEHR